MTLKVDRIKNHHLVTIGASTEALMNIMPYTVTVLDFSANLMTTIKKGAFRTDKKKSSELTERAKNDCTTMQIRSSQGNDEYTSGVFFHIDFSYWRY